MNVDELTLGQIREIQAMACAPKKAAPKLETKRVVLVVDRGWIFAGDQSLTSDGYIKLTNAVHVFRWELIGFAKAIKEWESSKVDVRRIDDVEVPCDSVIFRVPVPEGWGLK